MSVDFQHIPTVNVDPLFGGDETARAATDRALGRACEEVGFLLVSGRSLEALNAPGRIARLLRFFELPEGKRRPLARQRYVPGNTNVYRGYFPISPGERAFKEGIDQGPTFKHGDSRYPPGDPLVEQNVWPAEADLPGWRADMEAYHADMVALGGVLMRALARYLGLAEDYFERHFDGQNSTLRLLHFPPRTARALSEAPSDAFVEHGGRTYHLLAGEHTDSGVLTLLHQDHTGGLQAKNAAGTWIDVPPTPGTYVVNLGTVLQRWSRGRFRATPHRVLGRGEERTSVPFFFEPAVDAVIEPIPAELGAREADEDFAPVRYGDLLAGLMQRFVETRGVAVS